MSVPRVLHVIDRLERGGTERMLVTLLNGFDPRRFDHELVTLRRCGALTAQLPDTVACRPLNRAGRARGAGLSLAALIDVRRPTIIHARNTGVWFDAVVARVLRPRVRLVLSYHGLDGGGELSPRHRRLIRWGRRLGAGFLTVSEAGRAQLHRAGVPDARLYVIPNGVSTERFCPPEREAREAARRTFGFGPSDVVIGSVASLTPVKQPAALIACVADLAGRGLPVRLLLVGSGDLESALRTQAAGLGVSPRVSFAGWRDDVRACLAAMDIFACASLSEGMSNSLLEAMASGLPVVATDVGDNARVVGGDGAGRIVPSGDVASLARALADLAADPEARRDAGRAARCRAARFSIDAAIEAYESFYRRLTADRIPRGFGGASLARAAAVGG